MALNRLDLLGSRYLLGRRDLLGLGALIALAMTTPALAAADDACEKIKDADAYNKCLAGFGPARGAVRTRGAPPPGEVQRGVRARRRRRGAPAPATGAPGGRKRWIFSPRSG